MIAVVLILIIVLLGFVAFTGAPYLPSKRSDVKRAFDELYRLGPDDVLVDIGSGDGIVLRQASQRGARAIGYELHPLLVLLSRWLSRRDERVSVGLAIFWRTPLPDDVTVLYLFGDGRDIGRMVRYVQRQVDRIGRRVWLISYGFTTSELPLERSVGAHSLYRVEPRQATRVPDEK